MIKQILTFINFKARCIRINIQQFLGSSENVESLKCWKVSNFDKCIGFPIREGFFLPLNIK